MTKAERKKDRRKARAESERSAGREMARAIDESVTLAMALVDDVANSKVGAESERVIDVDFETVEAAKAARKRINSALQAGEWLSEVEVWVWQADHNVREPLSPRGLEKGFELRLERKH